MTVTTTDNAFNPTSVSVAEGGSIEVVNDGAVEHNLTVRDEGISEDVHEGETVDVGGLAPGSYDFFCEYHPQEMTGTLEITSE